jgi:AraC-like DNA-binding protein
MVCAVVRFGHPAARRLVSLLPAVLAIDARRRSPDMEWVDSTLRFMSAEASQLRPGGEAVITRLADILIIQAIRAWIAHDPAAQTGWLRAIQDKQIGRAIALIHRDPAQAWTVATLADEVAMSRSAFAARFTELVGEPAIQYATRWRMQVALTWLNDERARLADVASRLGYQSEAAFSRAFKRFNGVSPGGVRRGAARAAAVASAAGQGYESALR